MNFELYRQYFEHQAINHPDLAHDEQAGQRVFEVITIDEAFGDFRTAGKEKSFFFRLIEYTYSVGDNGTHQGQKLIKGGFQIGKYYSLKQGGKQAYLEAMQDAERVMDDIIRKIIVDSQNGHPLFNYSLDSQQNFSVAPIPVAGDGAYAGWECIFDFTPYFDCGTGDVEWLDDGLTPYDEA